MTKQPVAECHACRHSYADETGLRCKLFKTAAELPCARFEREPGSDVEEYIALQDGHVSPDMGRGD